MLNKLDREIKRNILEVELNDEIVNFYDLHFIHINDVEDEIENILNLNFLAKNKFLAFIHGYGSGKLKNKIHLILKKHLLVKYFWLKRDNANSGALTYVILDI